MALVEYTMDETVAILTMNSGENRFNPDFIAAFTDVLDTIETEAEAKTLIVTSGHEKIFSNGLDLEWLLPVVQNKETEKAKAFFYQLMGFYKRVLNYPLITVAAISGHAFAGGAIFCGAFDFRFMRSDRGFFCMPEIDLGIPFLPGMTALLRKAMPEYIYNELQYTGRRMTADECKVHKIVFGAFPQEELMTETLAFAKGLNKNRNTVAEMKKRTNAAVTHAIEVDDVPYIESGVFHVV